MIDFQCYNVVLVSVLLSVHSIPIVFFLIKKKLFWPSKASTIMYIPSYFYNVRKDKANRVSLGLSGGDSRPHI